MIDFGGIIKLIFKPKSYIVLLQICGEYTMDINLKIFFLCSNYTERMPAGF